MFSTRISIPRLCAISLLFFSVQGFSQTYINKSKAQVKKELDTYVTSNAAITPSVTETKKSIVLAVKGPGSLPASFTYGFNKKNKCISETVVSGCDSCSTKLLDDVLAHKEYQWKKINGNQYISTFESRMMIEISIKTDDYSFTILRTDWSREMYDLLKEQ